MKAYNPRTIEGLDLHAFAVLTATRTGRVIFGQLWFRDPTFDDTMHALYAPFLAKAINDVNPLRAFFS